MSEERNMQSTIETLALHTRALAQERAAIIERADALEEMIGARTKLHEGLLVSALAKACGEVTELSRAHADMRDDLRSIFDLLDHLLCEAINAGSVDAALEEHNKARTRAREREAVVRAIAVDLYHRGEGGKRPHKNVGIRVEHVPQYDKSAALRWATEKGVALALNKKAFEALVKADADAIPCATLVDTPKATISKDLSALLEEELDFPEGWIDDEEIPF